MLLPNSFLIPNNNLLNHHTNNLQSICFVILHIDLFWSLRLMLLYKFHDRKRKCRLEKFTH